MKQLHPIQLSILRKLLFAESLRFSDLKPHDSIENNLFVFHLDQMIESGNISKSDNRYSLTNLGKEFANRMDTENLSIPKQAKLSVVILSTRMVGGIRQWLIYTRLKQPFYGCQGFVTGKINYGESAIDAARREFNEETNLDGAPELTNITHWRVYDKETNELLEDKFFFYCKVNEPEGDLVGSAEGNYEWVDEGGIGKYITKTFTSVEMLIEEIEEVKNFDGSINFKEISNFTNKF